MFSERRRFSCRWSTFAIRCAPGNREPPLYRGGWGRSCRSRDPGNSASAGVLTYSWDGAGFSFDDGVNGSPSGTFKIDPPGSSLSSGAIVLNGSGPESGSYTPESNDLGDLTYTNPSGDLELRFSSNLNSGPQKAELEDVVWSSSDGETIEDASIVVGGAQLSDSIAAAAPGPATWALLGLGFAGNALVGVRRRNGAARPPSAMATGSLP